MEIPNVRLEDVMRLFRLIRQRLDSFDDFLDLTQTVIQLLKVMLETVKNGIDNPDYNGAEPA